MTEVYIRRNCNKLIENNSELTLKDNTGYHCVDCGGSGIIPSLINHKKIEEYVSLRDLKYLFQQDGVELT